MRLLFTWLLTAANPLITLLRELVAQQFETVVVEWDRTIANALVVCYDRRGGDCVVRTDADLEAVCAVCGVNRPLVVFGRYVSIIFGTHCSIR